MQNSKKKVVVMGGGNGSAISICALKRYTDMFDISAVISMLDSGYSTGAIRKFFNILPPGDILRAVLALSPYDFKTLKKIFNKNRISNLKKLNNDLQAARAPSLGNMIIALVAKYEGDFLCAIRGLEEVLETIGHAYPSTLDQADLVVELSSGDIVKGETKIDEPSYDRSFKITKALIEPEVHAYDQALKQIRDATCIVFGPGDLYTSIVASLLPIGIKEAIDESNAHLIYAIGNAYHTDGETGPEKLSDFILQLEQYLPRKIDLTIYNSAQLNKEQLQIYKERGWSLIENDKENISDHKIIEGNYERDSGGLCPQKLGNIFKDLSSNC